MTDGTDVIYTKLITNNKISKPFPKVPFIFWITTSSKNGLIFTTNGTSTITTFLSSDIHNKVSNIKQKNTTIFNFDCNILRINCNCSGEYLAILSKKSNEYFIHIYDTKTFSFEFSDTPYPLYVDYAGENEILDFQWNPTIEEMFAYTTGGNRIYCLEFNPAGTCFLHKRIDELKSKGNCISWSPKGKQLVVGCMDGSMLQYKPDLTLVRREPCPVIDGENELICIGICWLGTTDFVFAFERKKSQSFSISLLILKKNQPAQWTHLGNICKCVEKIIDPVRFYFENIVEWGLVLVASNNGLGVAFLEKNGDTYRHIELPEDKDILLELGETYEMPFLCGFVIDKSAVDKYKEVIDDVTIEYKPSPVIVLLNSNGILQSYWLVTKSDNYKSINVARETIIPYKIRNGNPQNENIKSMIPKTPSNGGIQGNSLPLTSNDSKITKKEPITFSPVSTSSETPKISIKKELNLLNTSSKNDIDIKIEAMEKEKEIKQQLLNKEKEVIKKVGEEVNLITELEKEKAQKEKEEELVKLRKICGELITEYYSRKNTNIVQIQAQENAINRVCQQIAITNDESVKELLKTLKVMTISQNKVSHWAQIVSEDIETLNETLVTLKNKISYMKKNKASVAETYFFDTKSSFDESENKLQKVKENFTKLTKAVELLNKKIESKGLMNNIAKLDSAVVIGPEDQEYIQNVSRNIVRATYVAFRKLKLLSDKYAELKKLKEKKDHDDLDRSFLNQSTTLESSFILDKTFIGETQNLFTVNRNKSKEFQNYLKKKCSKPVGKKFVQTLPFLQNITAKKDEEENTLENTVSNVKDMLEKCLIVSRSVNNSFSESQPVDLYLTKEDITKIRQNTLDEAKQYAADFKTTLEMTRKLMVAEMKKIDFNPQKEEEKEQVKGNRVEAVATIATKSIDKNVLPVDLTNKENVVSKPEEVENKNETIVKVPSQEDKSNVSKGENSDVFVKTEDSSKPTNSSPLTMKNNEKTSLTQTVTIESPKNLVAEKESQENNSPQLSLFGGRTPSSDSSKSIFGNEAQVNSETLKTTPFRENIENKEKPKSSLFFEDTSKTKDSDNAQTPIFGDTTKTPPQQGSFFGGSSITNTPVKPSVFGGSSVTQKQNIFGQSAFGGSQSSGGSVFGGSQQTGQSAFGGSQSKSVFGGSAFGGSFNNQATKPPQSDEGMDDGNNISTGFFSSMSGLGSQATEKKNVFAQSAFGASTNTSRDNSSFSFARPAQTNTFQQSSNAPKPGFFSNTGSSFGGSNAAFAKPAFGETTGSSFGAPSSNTSTFGKSAFGQSSFGQSSFSSFANKAGTGFSNLSGNSQQSSFGANSSLNKSPAFTQWR
ncbi:Nuclear pore complex protein Nup214 [Strongyloides ratti]|uniref:Nuclear pore complex protein Nup214 n=1 Tax=Strongyloides ratti TaxID=34506 RepID=A0A090KYC8_STRRB|nr:Nuclear pore complex protein Nup214 [Strongyloides ratti]CEF62446.1 Nuclear pore complex protein Nup214 [Strongyloides ratti]